MPVSAIAVSRDGNFIATGQYGLPSMKNSSVVNLWDYTHKQLLHTFEGLTENVNNLLFTDDLKFLFATDTNGLFVAWDIYNYETIAAKRVSNQSAANSIAPSTNQVTNSINSKHMRKQQASAINNPDVPCFISDLIILSIQNMHNSVHNTYTMLLAYDHKIYQWRLQFSVKHMEYVIDHPIEFTYPPSNVLKRDLTTIALNKNQTLLCAGTETGEIFIFDTEKKMFLQSFQV